MNRVRQVHRSIKSVRLAGDVNKWLYLVVSARANSGNRSRETRRQQIVVVGDVFEAIGKVRS